MWARLDVSLSATTPAALQHLLIDFIEATVLCIQLVSVSAHRARYRKIERYHRAIVRPRPRERGRKARQEGGGLRFIRIQNIVFVHERITDSLPWR